MENPRVLNFFPADGAVAFFRKWAAPAVALAVLEFLVIADFLWIRLAPPWPDPLSVLFLTIIVPLTAGAAGPYLVHYRSKQEILRILKWTIGLLVGAAVLYFWLSGRFIITQDNNRFYKMVIGWRYTAGAQKTIKGEPGISDEELVSRAGYVLEDVYERTSLEQMRVSLLIAWLLLYSLLSGVSFIVVMVPMKEQTMPPPPKTRGYFISYRRGDGDAVAARIYESLVPRYGPERVWLDRDSIGAGEHFPTFLEEKARTCDVLLAVIGHEWADRWLEVVDRSTGIRRLEDANDWVRKEISLALQRADALVIPVLIDGIAMPKPDQMPESLKDFASKNARAIRHGSHAFREDMDALIQEAEKWLLESHHPQESQK